MSQTDAEDEDVKAESFMCKQQGLDQRNHTVLASKLALFAATGQAATLEGEDGIDGECISVDPETQARLEALLEAAGIGKLSTSDGKAFADPEVLRRLTSSVSCALDEAAAALSRMRAEAVGQDSHRSLSEACSDGDISTVRRLLNEGRSVHETTEDGESLLSLACSAGYYELAEVLLSMRANIEDRGRKGECTPLMEAASGGYKDIVQLLINHGADLNATSNTGNTALTFACCGGYVEIVKVLIEAGVDLEIHNENGHTPLMEAASGGHVEVASLLLQHGAGINTHSNEFKESALTLACYKGHLEMVRFLLQAGADQEHKTDEMHTALMEASMDGHVDVARLLLDSGAHVNMPADSFESPLTLAACGGHVELASLLLVRGANVEEVNDEGYTPLMEASREGHEEMVAILLAHGAKVNVQTEETQETALTLACCGGFLECCSLLVQARADLEAGCSTPLMEAAQEGHLDLVKFLIRQGASIHTQTSGGDTALSYACEHGHTDVAELLLSAGAFLEQESEGGRTPLMKAARAGHLCTVQFLISQGADVNKTTRNNDHSVLSLACVYGHLSVIESLLYQGADPLHKLKDNSTMLLEAAKGGHTNVVRLLLDFHQNFMNAANSLPPSLQVSSPLSDHYTPRVPTQALPMIVPPQEPDKAPCDVHWYPKSSSNRVRSLFNEALDTAVEENYVCQEENSCNHFHPIPERSGEALRYDHGEFSCSPDLLRSDGNVGTNNQASCQNCLVDSSTSGESAAGKEMSDSIKDFLQSVSTDAVVNSSGVEMCTSVKHLLASMAPDTAISDENVLGNSIDEETQGKLRELEHRIKEAIEKNAQLKSLEPFQNEQFKEENVKEMYRTREEQILKKQKILEELQKIERDLQEKTVKDMKKYHLVVKENENAAPAFVQRQHILNDPRGKPDGEAAVSDASNKEEPTLLSSSLLSVITNSTDNAIVPDVSTTKALIGELVNQDLVSQVSTVTCQETKANALDPKHVGGPIGPPPNFVMPLHQQEQEEGHLQYDICANEDSPMCDHLPCTTPQLTHPLGLSQKSESMTLEVAAAPVPFTTENITQPMPVDSSSRYCFTDIDCCTESNHDTPLTLACAGGHEELVQLLISRNANIEHRDKKGFTPLILAATAGHVNVVSILVNANADIESQSERTKDTPLSLACSGGRLDVVELLLARGANKEHRNVSDYTPLSLAASGGYVRIIELLLDSGAEINSRTGSKLGISPLMLAAMNGHAHAVLILLDRGADINAQIETNRNTALTLACFQGRHEVVSLLVDRRANVEHRAKTGLTPLMEAASGGYAEVGKVLLEKGADVNAAPVPSSRDTALTIAADKGHYRFCELVLARLAQVDVRNKKGNTPLWLACNGGHLDVAQLLVRSGADSNATDNRNITPLMAAFRRGHVKVTRWLVKEVCQFPSDAECMRYIATISDRELLKRCHMCMECIVAAKDRQAQEANKFASQLLAEIDKEKSQEENRRERAARKREKKRIKRKQKQKLSKKTDNNSDMNAEEEPEEECSKENEDMIADRGDSKIPGEISENIYGMNMMRTVSNDQLNIAAGKDVHSKMNGSEVAASTTKQSATRVPSHNSEKNCILVVADGVGNREASTNVKKSPFSAHTSSVKMHPSTVKVRHSTQQLASANTVTARIPVKKTQRREEGWKEVVRKSKRVMIPSNLISRVIGRGGCNVNAIREVTGAHIDIDKQRKGGQERAVTIRGPMECIRHAHLLITELTKDCNSDQDINIIINRYKKAQTEALPATQKTATSRQLTVVEAPLPSKPAWMVPALNITRPITSRAESEVKNRATATEKPQPIVCAVQGNAVTNAAATSKPNVETVRKALFSPAITSSSSARNIDHLFSNMRIQPNSNDARATSGFGKGNEETTASSLSKQYIGTHTAPAVSFITKTSDKQVIRPVQPVAPMVSVKSAKTTVCRLALSPSVVMSTRASLAAMPDQNLAQQPGREVEPQQLLQQFSNSDGILSSSSGQLAGSTPVNSAAFGPAYSPFNNYMPAGRTSIWNQESSPMGLRPENHEPVLMGQQLAVELRAENCYKREDPSIPQDLSNEHTSGHQTIRKESSGNLAVSEITRTSAVEDALHKHSEKNEMNLISDVSNAQNDRKIRPIGTERAYNQRRVGMINPSSEISGIWSFSNNTSESECAPNWSSTDVNVDISPAKASPSSQITVSEAEGQVASGIILMDEENCNLNDPKPTSPDFQKPYPTDCASKVPSTVNETVQIPFYSQASGIAQVQFASGMGSQPPIGSHLGGVANAEWGLIQPNFITQQPIGAHLASGSHVRNQQTNMKKNFHGKIQEMQQFPHPEHSRAGVGWQQRVQPVPHQNAVLNNKYVAANDMYRQQVVGQKYGHLGGGHGDGTEFPASRDYLIANGQHSLQYQAQQQALIGRPCSNFPMEGCAVNPSSTLPLLGNHYRQNLPYMGQIKPTGYEANENPSSVLSNQKLLIASHMVGESVWDQEVGPVYSQQIQPPYEFYPPAQSMNSGESVRSLFSGSAGVVGHSAPGANQTPWKW